jgi:hypothetical protein
MSPDDRHDMIRTVPWPFRGDAFPPELGAVVQRTVLDDELPARVVGHGEDGDWYVGDGVNDPNVSGACIATHIQHVVERDPSVASLASMPPGHEARRTSHADAWRIVPHAMPD